MERYHNSEKYTKQRGDIKRVLAHRPASQRWCNDKVKLDPNDPNYMSINQRLVGKANPKTLIPPVIPVPLSDLSYWKANNLITHSNINSQTQYDAYGSGYQVTDCCKTAKCSTNTLPCSSDKVRTVSFNKTTPMQQKHHHYAGEVIEPFQQEKTYEKEYSGNHDNNDYDIEEYGGVGVGQINMGCGYNINNIKSGLPVNLPVGPCAKDRNMREYNEQLFTQTVQPGVYTRSQVNEPINSNIGISFDQQFNPTVEQIDPNTGDILFTQVDPSIVKPVNLENMDVIEAIDQSNVYDPRLTGYGTSYRAYTNDELGRTDFYYKDVDAIRAPNYISRSNIDFAKYADKYGPLPQGFENGNPNTNNIREFVHNSWLKSSIGFRNDISTRKMRKTNAEHWQRRKAPMRGQVHTSGGMSLRA